MLIVYTNYHIGNGAAVQDCLQQQFSDTTAGSRTSATTLPRHNRERKRLVMQLDEVSFSTAGHGTEHLSKSTQKKPTS